MSSFNYVTIQQHSIMHTKYQIIIIIIIINSDITMIGVIGFNDYKLGLNSFSSLKHDVGELIRQIQDEAMCLRTYGASLVLLMGEMMTKMMINDSDDDDFDDDDDSDNDISDDDGDEYVDDNDHYNFITVDLKAAMFYLLIYSYHQVVVIR
jgi:hypothetical protein